MASAPQRASEEPEQQQEASTSGREDEAPSSSRRRICSRCSRPERVCLCAALTSAPLALRGKVVLLTHPYEAKRRLSTVPLLRLLLGDGDDGADALLVIRRRRLVHGASAEFDALLNGAAAGRWPLLVLLPGPGAEDVAVVAARIRSGGGGGGGGERHSSQQQQQQQPADNKDYAYVLLAIDGTWREAKEMANVLRAWLLPPAPGAVARQVQLSLDDDDGVVDASTAPPPPSDLRLRTEPAEGCVSTAEAVARAVGALEAAPALCAAMLAPLRLMTAMQAAYDPAVRARVREGGFNVVASRRAAALFGGGDGRRVCVLKGARPPAD